MKVQEFIIDFYKNKEYYKYSYLVPRFIEIEDIANDIFYIILKNKYRFPTKQSFLSFFKKSLKNLCISEIYRLRKVLFLFNFEDREDDNRDAEDIVYSKCEENFSVSFIYLSPDIIYEKEKEEEKKENIRNQVKDIIFSDKVLKDKYNLSSSDIQILREIYNLKFKKNYSLGVIYSNFPQVPNYHIDYLYKM